MEARTLDVACIVATSERLAARVHERFPDRGIARLAAELVTISRETELRLATARRPRWLIRGLIVAFIIGGLAVVIVSATRVQLGSDIEGIDEWLAVIQNGIQDVVFVGIAVAFLVTLENRIRRRDVLAGLHELRSVAHVIDMHQLTKDPDALRRPDDRTAHSPPHALEGFPLGRYLDYCSEMLALTSKLAALYAQESTDSTVLSAVREIETIVGALSNKIWQKIMILDTLDDAATPASSAST